MHAQFWNLFAYLWISIEWFAEMHSRCEVGQQQISVENKIFLRHIEPSIHTSHTQIHISYTVIRILYFVWAAAAAAVVVVRILSSFPVVALHRLAAHKIFTRKMLLNNSGIKIGRVYISCRGSIPSFSIYNIDGARHGFAAVYAVLPNIHPLCHLG